ncbi:hypothetical protein PTTG_30800 [Puccinia triticina 1-1 BBBD Race 1]|uniref:PI3K/PI4K domain-containing protein n=1 Tax=Puccinia triticina (isolate 1-1 / race 1 (BBBD)) TaxID=630390 RepID=A0A180FY43_PUCT1|nr:hypothetical protein PTTG_30800 [Puccinia triticina 1-1 BBBD Race 1]
MTTRLSPPLYGSTPPLEFELGLTWAQRRGWRKVGPGGRQGDRHPGNILVSDSTYEVIHIDYGICFGQGLNLIHPKVVPFQFTPNLELLLQDLTIRSKGRWRKGANKDDELRIFKHFFATTLWHLSGARGAPPMPTVPVAPPSMTEWRLYGPGSLSRHRGAWSAGTPAGRIGFAQSAPLCLATSDRPKIRVKAPTSWPEALYFP